MGSDTGVDGDLLHPVPAAQKDQLGRRVRGGPIPPTHLSHVQIRLPVTIEVGHLQGVRVEQPVVQHLGFPQVLDVRSRPEQCEAPVRSSDIEGHLAQGYLRPPVTVEVGGGYPHAAIVPGVDMSFPLATRQQAIPGTPGNDLQPAIAVDIGGCQSLLVHAGDHGPNVRPRGDVRIVGQRDPEQRLGVLVPDVQLPPPVAVDVREQQVVGSAGGQRERVPACPPLGGIGRALPPVDAPASIAGGANQVQPATAGEVDESAADADAREGVVHQVRLPRAAARSPEPVELIRMAGGDDELGYPVVVQITDETVHAFAGRSLVDGVAAKSRQFRHLAYLQR